jgi:hypothetical protein
VTPAPIELPATFVFDHVSLQDFVDCPRRFYLRYVEQLRSPAPEAAPLRDFDAERERDLQFHRLVHQHLRGLPLKALEATITDDVVAEWWKAYRKYALVDLPKRHLPHASLSAPLAGRRLVARYDMLAFSDDRATIIEWKTELERPTRETLQRRIQTVVYPYLLAQAGAQHNNGQRINPARISLIYWFTEAPQQPELFEYNAEQFTADGVLLDKLAADILNRSADAFELTDNLDLCQFCAYRSLNGRGTTAGSLIAAPFGLEGDGFSNYREYGHVTEAGF